MTQKRVDFSKKLNKKFCIWEKSIIFAFGFNDESTDRTGFRNLIWFFVMTVEFLNANVKIVNVNGLVFTDENAAMRYFSRGFAFYVPGAGYLGFSTVGYPYVLPRKKTLQSILSEGGFTSLNNISFFKGTALKDVKF